jgi:hypothetical protein
MDFVALEDLCRFYRGFLHRKPLWPSLSPKAAKFTPKAAKLCERRNPYFMAITHPRPQFRDVWGAEARNADCLYRTGILGLQLSIWPGMAVTDLRELVA